MSSYDLRKMWTITVELYISDKSVSGLISIGHYYFLWYCSLWYRIPPSPGPVAALARIPGPPPPSLPASPGKKPRYRRVRSPGSLTALSSPPGGHGRPRDVLEGVLLGHGLVVFREKVGVERHVASEVVPARASSRLDVPAFRSP